MLKRKNGAANTVIAKAVEATLKASGGRH